MSTLRVLWKIMSPSQRSSYRWLVLLAALNSVTELVAIAAVAFFMRSLHPQPGSPTDIFSRMNLSIPQWGCLALGLFTISNVALGLAAWARAAFSWEVEIDLSARLLEASLRSIDIFGSESSAMFVHEISGMQVTQKGLGSSLIIWSRLFTTALLVGALLVTDWKATLVAAIMLSIVFAILLTVLNGPVRALSRAWNKSHGTQQRLMQEILAMRKLLYIRQRWSGLVSSYRDVCRSAVRASGHGSLAASLPRYVLETATMGGIILLCVHLVHTNDRQILESMTLFGLAAYRILPGLYDLFGANTELEMIRPKAESTLRMLQTEAPPQATTRLPFSKSFRLTNVTVTHSGRVQPALRNVSLELPAGLCLGLAGSSGAGKSTLIDVCMGLLRPQSGTFEVDGQALSPQHWREWRRNLGYLPQQVEVLDDSIAANITLGLDVEVERINAVVAQCHLTEVIASLPDGLETRVGEGGAFLSVGQRQRMGLARALYEDPPVLILDEMSASLDPETEEYILREVQALFGQKTILMAAHREAVLRICDCVLFLDKGEVVAFGDFQTLWDTVPQFRSLLSQKE